jgi:hypothetical protein
VLFFYKTKGAVVSKKPQRTKGDSAVSKLIFLPPAQNHRKLGVSTQFPKTAAQDAFDGMVVA